MYANEREFTRMYENERESGVVAAPWLRFTASSRGQMISNDVYKFISTFDKAGSEERQNLISANPMQVTLP